MTSLHQLGQKIRQAFPRIEAPAEFRAYCAKTIQEVSPDEAGLGDDRHAALAYRGLNWWELAERIRRDGRCLFMIEETAAFLEPAVWSYYLPVYLLAYVDIMQGQNISDKASSTDFLENWLGSARHQEKLANLLTATQKNSIAQIIRSAAADVPPGTSRITPETLAYWSQFQQPA